MGRKNDTIDLKNLIYFPECSAIEEKMFWILFVINLFTAKWNKTNKTKKQKIKQRWSSSKYANIGCLNIHGTHVTANNFTNNVVVTLHKYLSQDESLFYAHVTSGAVWHLTLRKISPSQDSYFGHMVQASNVGVNLGLDSSPTLARGFPISLSNTPPSPSFSYPHG